MVNQKFVVDQLYKLSNEKRVKSMTYREALEYVQKKKATGLDNDQVLSGIMSVAVPVSPSFSGFQTYQRPAYKVPTKKHVAHIIKKGVDTGRTVQIADASVVEIKDRKGNVIDSNINELTSFGKWIKKNMKALTNTKRQTIVITISVYIDFSVSAETRELDIKINQSDLRNLKQLEQTIYDEVGSYWGDVVVDGISIDWDGSYVDVRDQIQAKKDMKTMKLQESGSLVIESEHVDNNSGMDGKCFERYLRKNWAKSSKNLSEKKQKELYEGPHTAQALFEFCQANNISVTIYDVLGHVIVQHKHVGKSSVKAVKAIVHNNHLYGLNSPIEEFMSDKKHQNIEIVEDIMAKIAEIVNKGYEPTTITHKNRIVGCIHSSVLYLFNPDYEYCNSILKKLDLEDWGTPFMSVTNLITIIESFYIPNLGELTSFTPNLENYTITDYHYKSDDYEKRVYDQIQRIDANKFYPSIMKEIEFIPSFDFKSDRISVYKGEDILSENLYLVQPKTKNHLLPSRQVEIGAVLIEAKKRGIEFDILEVMHCNVHRNYYGEMIEDLFNKIPEEVKTIIVPLFGRFRMEWKYPELAIKTSKIVNNEELETQDCDKIAIEGTKYSIAVTYEENKMPKIVSRKPLAIYMMGLARLKIFDKIKELESHGIKDIIRIKVDSIAFVAKTNPLEDNREFGGWKHEKFERDDACIHHYDYKIESLFGHSEYMYNPDNTLCLAYAGAGKTYHVLNEIIPKYGKENVIVCTPTHTTKNEYLEYGVDCQVVQYYSNNQILPDRKKVMIFDEISMYGNMEWNVVISCIYRDQVCIALGDFNQLQSVGTNCIFNRKHFLNMYFQNTIELKDNRRNEFSVDEYNKFIMNSDEEVAYAEIEKVQVGWEDAEVIICYRNSTVESYNEKMLEKLGMCFGDIGCKVLAKTNKFSKYGVFNNQAMKVVKKDDKYVYFDNGKSVPLRIFKNDDTHFRCAYARTVYGVQGSSLKSIHYAVEDKSFLRFGKIFYTVISRIKTKE